MCCNKVDNTCNFVSKRKLCKLNSYTSQDFANETKSAHSDASLRRCTPTSWCATTDVLHSKKAGGNQKALSSICIALSTGDMLTSGLAIVLATMIMGSACAQQAEVHYYEWEVDYYKMSPDCQTSPKDVLGVHQILPEEIVLNTFPGPTIRAREGDRIEVKVTNKISKPNPFGGPERVSIHWHGILQKGTPWNDGVTGLTECGIPQNGTYTYKFGVDKAGTYFWHGHYNAQRTVGLYGLLIVDQRLGAVIPTYDGEFNITVNDWWQTDVYDQLHGLDNYQKWTWVDAPQSFLIKGDSTPCQKYVSCPSAELECNTNTLQSFSKTQGGSGAGKLIWNVLPGNTYLVRLACVTSSAFLNFVIEGHSMTVIEADGQMVQPFNTTSIDILSGQTYAFTFTTQGGPGYPDQRVYHIGVNARDGIADSKNAKGTDPGLAVLSYNFPNINQTVTPSPTDATTLWDSQPVVQQGGPRWNDTAFGYYFANQIQALIGYSYPVPMREDVTLAFVIHQMRINDADNNSRFVMRWTLNNISYNSSEELPLLAQLMNSSKDGETEKPLPQIGSSDFKGLVHLDDITGNRTLNGTNSEAMRGGYYLLKGGDIVTVVLQNSAKYNTTASEAHPWHLHGHDFWVLGYGDGLYDPDTSPQGFNLVNAPVKNTVPVFGGGWVAIRFIADNPGVWSFHCHNEWHMYLGMKVVFAYGVDDIPRPNSGQNVSQCH